MTPAFITLAEDILTFEVDNRQRQKGKENIIVRRDFWQTVYHPRPEDQRRFDSFIASDTLMLFVTGHVGTGKSTFIRRKFEHENPDDKICSGLIIDMKGKTNFFKKELSVGEVFQNILRDAYRRALMLNFKAAVRKNDKEPYHNHLYHIEADLPELDEQEEYDLAIEYKAKCQLAIEAACLLNDDNEFARFLLSQVPKFNPLSSIPSREQLETLITPEIALDIIEFLKWDHVMALFIRLDHSARPHIVVFDNLDRVHLRHIKAELVDRVEDLLQRMNRFADAPYSLKQGPSVAKAIIAIRDENISRVNFEGGGAKKVHHIAMSRSDYRITDNHEYSHLTIDLDFVIEVVNRRLQALGERVAPEDRADFEIYNSFIRQYWLEEGGLLDEFGKFNIKDLCNDSLRQILEIIHRSTIALMEHLHLKKIPGELLSYRFSYQMFRGKIIRSLWLHDSFKDIMKEFIRSLNDEKTSHYCCLLRLLLIYLHKQKQHSSIFQELFKDFNRLFKYTEDNYRERLWRLYNTNTKQGELITIYQRDSISEHLDIDSSCTIRLNDKGRVFFETIILNIDFYGLVANGQNPKDLKLPVLHEMLPAEAIGYLNKTYDLVRDLADQHLSFWQNNLVYHIRRLQETPPFLEYSKYFAHGDCFHLERVCDSHRYSIKNYLLEVLKAGEASNLLFSREDMELLRQTVGQNYFDLEKLASRTDDAHLRNLFEKYFPNQHDLNRIWRLYEQYGDLKNKFEKVRAENPPLPTHPLDVQNIETLLGQDDIEEAIDVLLEFGRENKLNTSDIIVLQGNFTHAQRQYSKDRLNERELAEMRSRTKDGLLDICREWLRKR